MSASGFPFRPIHPGELLKDEFEYRHLSQKEVAKQLGVPYITFNEILNGKRPVSTDLALLLEAAYGFEPSMLLRMQTDYNLQTAKQNKTLSDRIAKIRQIAASVTL